MALRNLVLFFCMHFNVLTSSTKSSNVSRLIDIRNLVSNSKRPNLTTRSGGKPRFPPLLVVKLGLLVVPDVVPPRCPTRVCELHPPTGRPAFRLLMQEHDAYQQAAASVAHEAHANQIAPCADDLSQLLESSLRGVDVQQILKLCAMSHRRVQVDRA